MALSLLLERVSSPEAEKKDVDALLAGLARPLAADESPRARADFLLGVLNSRRLFSMKGNNGETVQDTAVRALTGLGPPYALEIPPAALVRPRQLPPPSRRTSRRRIPWVGIVLALGGSLTSIPWVKLILAMYGGPSAILLLPLEAALWVAPAVFTIFGGKTGMRGAQTTGLVLLGLQSLSAIVIGGVLTHEGLSGGGALDLLVAIFGVIGVGIGACLALSAYLLRHPAWHVEETAPAGDEAT